MKLREALADALVAEDVQLLFALMGDANLELICDVAERCGVPVVFGRHEQGVVGMADGYARSSGQPGVATVTQGPGLTNAATSLVVAARRRSPVLLLAGDAPVGDLHNAQLFDQASFGHLTAGYGARIDAAAAFEELLAEAFRTVRSDSPFVLNLPTDIQNAELASDWRYEPRYATSQPVLADPTLVDIVATTLADARRPAVLAGRGAVASGAGPALCELSELLAAPLLTTLLANGLFDGAPLNAGVCGGLGDGRALRALEHCDVIVAVGASLNQWTTHFGSATTGRKLIQIDADPAAFSGQARPDVTLQGDAKATAIALTDRLRDRLTATHLVDPALALILDSAEPRDPSPYLDTDHSLDPRHFLDELDRALPPERSVVIGGGHCAQVACFTIRASAPEDWTCTSIDFGALGQGLPVAVGACFARPDKRVAHITGDGDLMMGISELDTAIRYSLPLTIFVLNDQAMGQERHNLVHMNLPTRYASYVSPDFAELASAMGAAGYRIESTDGLAQINQALEGRDGVVVVDVRINGEYLNPVSRDIAEHLG
jgi:thiamine pyrophosphate-dependent acetolactate synthase large subunit-like protein